MYPDQVSIYILQNENVYVIYFGNMAQNCQILRMKYCQMLILEFHYYQRICKNVTKGGKISGYVIGEKPKVFFKVQHKLKTFFLRV